VSFALFVWASPTATAQTVDAAHGPLFGANVLNGARRSIDLTASVTGGRDDDLSADSGTGGSPLQPHVGGTYQDFDGALSLVESGRRISLAIRSTGTVRHVPGLDQFAGSNAAVNADLSVFLDRRTSLRTIVSASHVENFAFDTLAQQRLQATSPDDTIPSSSAGADAPLDWTRTAYGGNMTLTRAIGKVSSFSFTAGAGLSRRPTLDQRSAEQGATAQFSRSLGRDSFLRVAYTYSSGLQTIPDARNKLWSQELQMSADRTWRHSKFRRTVVSLSAGPSIFQQKLTASVSIVPDVPADGDAPPEPVTVLQETSDRLFRFVGTATVVHDITSSWSTQAWYRRGTGVRDAVLFANAGGLDLHGWFGRRIGTTLAAGYTDGDLNLGSLLNRNTTLYGSMKLQAALKSWAAVQAQYFYYHYEYRAAVDLPNGLLPRLNRRGLRVGIVLWAPLERGRS
jgi:hypothetical protein